MTDQPNGFPPPQQHNAAAGFGAPGTPGAPYGQPQGQPQQGFGAAPEGQAGFGAAPGQPQFGAPGQPPQFGAPGQQPPQFGAPGSFTPGVEEPKKGGGKGKLAGILAVVGVVGVGLIIKVALGLGGAAVANTLAQDPTKDAKVGDCLDDTPELKEGEEGSANNVGMVDCADADATSVIIGRKDNLTLIQAQDEEQCYEFVNDGESFTMLWPTDAEANKYYVLCLKDK